MYSFREITDNDLDFVEQTEFILSLQIRWCGDFDKRYSGAVIDESGETVGVYALSFHSTWYCDTEPQNKLIFNYCYKSTEVMPELIKGAHAAFERAKADFPQKKAVLTVFITAEEFDETQALLHGGFVYNEVIPVLKYDIKDTVTHNALPNGVTIEKVGRDDDAIGEYLAATGAANNGHADSKAEYMFRSGDESFLSFRAVYGGKTVGGISVWNIGEKHCATENIFTIPEFRKKGIASELIATAFEEIKNRGATKATLSMLGSNVKAMRLYQKIGYKLLFYIMELKAADND